MTRDERQSPSISIYQFVEWSYGLEGMVFIADVNRPLGLLTVGADCSGFDADLFGIVIHHMQTRLHGRVYADAACRRPHVNPCSHGSSHASLRAIVLHTEQEDSFLTLRVWLTERGVSCSARRTFFASFKLGTAMGTVENILTCLSILNFHKCPQVQ